MKRQAEESTLEIQGSFVDIPPVAIWLKLKLNLLD